MNKKVAIIDKAPNKVKYQDYFPFEFEVFHLSQVPITKLLKKDVTLEFDSSEFDLVILVGSEAAKHIAGITSVTNMAGVLVDDKFVAITNPAMLTFKPEGKIDFQRAVDRILKIYETGNTVTIEGDFKGIEDETEALAYLDEVIEKAQGVVGWDTETTALYTRDGYVLGISMSYGDKQGRYISSDCISDAVVAKLQYIADTFLAVFHNMKFDIKMIEYHFGIKFNRNRVDDTMCMHYVLDENDSHGLKHLAIKYTEYGDYDKELEEFKKAYCKENGIKEGDFTYDLIPFNIICIYASKDTGATLALRNKFWPIIQANEKLLWVYKELLIKGTLALLDMEEHGIPLSKSRLECADVYLTKEVSEAKQRIYEYPEIHKFEADEGVIFNPNSVFHLRKVLFDYLGLDTTGKKTATGADSTDAEVLEQLAELHPLPKALLTVRKLSKMQNTYVSKILPEIDRDGRIRTNFNLTFTTSGRLSSSGKFNAQQIVRDDPIIKGCIEAPEGYKIVSQDLATAEVYFAAVLSGDTNLQAVFKTGGDLHSTIAKMVFDLPCEVKDVKKLYSGLRQAAKAIN